MREILKYDLAYPDDFADHLTRYIESLDCGIILRSNSYLSKKDKQSVRSSYDFIAGLSALTVCRPTKNKLSTLRETYSDVNDWIFGYIGYDIKNEIEELTSENIDGLEFNDLFFFQPKVVMVFKEDKLNVKYFPNTTTVDEINTLVVSLDRVGDSKDFISGIKHFKRRFSKEEYINTVNEIKSHIQRGDIYEMNFCQEFFNDDADLRPADTFIALNRYSPTPFATFLKKGNNYIISASPERFLKKKGNVIVSQPIKGTIARSICPEEDESIKQHLKNDPKERAENIMIVDLVRNDLSKIAEVGSVNVDELCGVYPFRQLFQMISTISCKLKKEHDFVDVLLATFPMGSMTGA